MYIIEGFWESIVQRLISFLNKSSMLSENQFGFRKSHSTHMALLTLMDKLVHAIENGEYVMGVFLDFSKVFDTVNHSILLDKLYNYGIRGCVHKWLKIYLTNRTHFVTYNSTVSDHQMIKCCVPQGSLLGPLLFLVYVNDLPLCVALHYPYYLLMTRTCFWVAVIPHVLITGWMMI